MRLSETGAPGIYPNWPVGTSHGILLVSSLAQVCQMPITTAYRGFAALWKTAAFQGMLLKPEDKHCFTEQFPVASVSSLTSVSIVLPLLSISPRPCIYLFSGTTLALNDKYVLLYYTLNYFYI